MGLKHSKYVYVLRSDGIYVKVRLLKSSADEESRYIVVGPTVRVPPPTAKVIREETLPEKVRQTLYSV